MREPLSKQIEMSGTAGTLDLSNGSWHVLLVHGTMATRFNYDMVFRKRFSFYTQSIQTRREVPPRWPSSIIIFHGSFILLQFFIVSFLSSPITILLLLFDILYPHHSTECECTNGHQRKTKLCVYVSYIEESTLCTQNISATQRRSNVPDAESARMGLRGLAWRRLFAYARTRIVYST